jgi:hypothetical protein
MTEEDLLPAVKVRVRSRRDPSERRSPARMSAANKKDLSKMKSDPKVASRDLDLPEERTLSLSNKIRRDPDAPEESSLNSLNRMRKDLVSLEENKLNSLSKRSNNLDLKIDQDLPVESRPNSLSRRRNNLDLRIDPDLLEERMLSLNNRTS